MRASHILARLQQQGIRLSVYGNNLKVQADAQPDEETLELIHQHKADLIAALEPKDELSMNDAIAELLMRYQIGEFKPGVRHRLAEIFRDAPPDAMERLHKACEFLGIDGLQVDEVADKALSQDRTVN